jgi:phosphatidylglycerophosphate synthase
MQDKEISVAASSASPSWETSLGPTQTASQGASAASSAAPDVTHVAIPAEIGPTEETRRLVDVLVDLPNRYVHYPLARALYVVAKGLPFTPNQVTVFHALLALLASAMVAFADRRWFWLAFVVMEIRAVLDCYDGVLARRKSISSPYGRTVDELSDAVGYIALNLGIAWRVWHESHVGVTWLLMCLVIASGALQAWSHDFYKRKFTAALTHGKDSVVPDLRPKYQLIQRGKADFIVKFGLFFDTMQVKVLSRRSAKETLRQMREADSPVVSEDVPHILAHADTIFIRVVMRMLGIMTGDNGFVLLIVGVLLGKLWEAQIVTLAWGVISLAATILAMNAFLSKERAPR